MEIFALYSRSVYLKDDVTKGKKELLLDGRDFSTSPAAKNEFCFIVFHLKPDDIGEQMFHILASSRKARLLHTFKASPVKLAYLVVSYSHTKSGHYSS